MFLFFLKESFLGRFSCFEILIEVPKFKENIVKCIITIKNVRDLLLTLLQVITILAV